MTKKLKWRIPLWAYVKFQYLNYVRNHRYIREILVVVLFHIFFWGFLTGDKSDEGIWIVFSVYAILLNIVTAPSLFFFEKGNTLYFLIGKPLGRQRFFLSKVLFIILVDVFWVIIFVLIYGLRFFSLHYFMMLPIHLIIITFQLLITTLLISLSFSYQPVYSWIVILLIILGSIVNKIAILPIRGVKEFYKVGVFLLPPLLEFIFFNASLAITSQQLIFLMVGLIQAILLLYICHAGIRQKDFI